MKKLLLLAAGALLAGSSALAEDFNTWALVGSFSNWENGTPAVFSGSGNELTATVENLTNDFKIVPYDNNSINWDYCYSTTQEIALDKTYTLTGRNGGADLSNMKFGGDLLSVTNAIVTWNPSTAEMKITGTAVTGLPVLYLTGLFGDINWPTPGSEGSIKCTEANGIYTVTANFGQGDDKKEFKLSGEGWSNEIAGGVEVNETEAVKVTKGGGNLYTYLSGEQTLTFNYNTMSMTFGDPSLANEQLPDVWKVIGTYSEWNGDNSKVLEGNGDELSCTIDYLSSGFKIVNTTLASWEWCGSEDIVKINTPITIAPVDGDQGNLSFSNGITLQGYKNVTVKFNTKTYSLTVSAKESDAVIEFPELYIVGSFNPTESGGWTEPWDSEDAKTYQMLESDGTYEIEIDLGDAESTSFQLAGKGWTNKIGGKEEDIVVSADSAKPTSVIVNGAALTTTLNGKQFLYFDSNEMTMWFSETQMEKPDEDDQTPEQKPEDKPGNTPSGDGDGDTTPENPGSSSVDSLNSESAPAVYYNLQGMPVKNPTHGIFIVNGKKVVL